MRDDELIELTRGIAKRLGADWTVSIPEYADNASIECKDGRSLHVTRPHGTKRLNVRASGWPSYTEVTRDWRAVDRHVSTVRPGDLYDPKESTPEASIAIERGLDTICKEIGRRVMIEYARLWTRCAAKAQEAQAYQDAKEHTWARVCQAAGVPSSKSSVDLVGSLDITPGSKDTVYVQNTGSLDAEDAIAIIELLKARKARKGAA